MKNIEMQATIVAAIENGDADTLQTQQGPEVATVYRMLSIQDQTFINYLDSGPKSKGTCIHKIPKTELYVTVGTCGLNGLKSQHATEKYFKFGPNLINPPRVNRILLWISYFFGGFCWILWIAALFVFLSWRPFGDPPLLTNLALAILLVFVIFLQAGFSAYQDYTSSKIMKSIQSMLPTSAIVIRDGLEKRLPLADLVVGDLVKVAYGNKIPADIRFISVNGLKIDNSVLTGESIPVNACDYPTDENIHVSRNIGFMGTFVTEGHGLGIVIATGEKTVMGRIAILTGNTRNKKTLLQLEIQRFVYIIAILALSTGTVCMIIWALWLRVAHPGFMTLSNMLATNFGGVIVAFVPNGLPVAVTLVLSIIAKRMYAQKVLVKNLSTVETLGAVNVLCSDKTGTLTANQMIVARIATCDLNLEIGHFDLKEDSRASADSILQLIKMLILFNNDSSFDPEDDEKPILIRRINGNATDNALLRFAYSTLDVDKAKQAFVKVNSCPFNSKTKWMATIVKPTRANNNLFAPQTSNCILLLKGAPDYILPFCTKYTSKDSENNVVEMDLNPTELRKFREIQESWSSQGQRVLLLAYKKLPENEKSSNIENEEWSSIVFDLVIIGFIGIMDPPRPEIKDVVRQCRGAGIRMFMVTGDYSLTASSIAKQVGIFSSESCIHNYTNLTKTESKLPLNECSLVLSGSDLENLSTTEWDRLIQYKEIVFARTSPEQKLVIVKAFQSAGNIVAVTGDGVNDAPALKNSNIGIAMGSGSDVALEASSMVLLDSNFSSIIVALKQGRTVFENLKKVCIYLLPAGSFSELTPVLSNLFLGIPLPLSPFLMIVICMVTDMSPSLSLMYENPESDLLKRLPRNPKQDSLVNWKLFLHAYFFIGLLETFFGHLMYFIYLKSEWDVSPNQLIFAFEKWGRTEGYAGLTIEEQQDAIRGAQCVFFITLVIAQFGNLFAARTRKLSVFHQSPLSNPYLFLAMFISTMAAVVVIYVPFFQDVFQTYPITIDYWLIPIPLALLLLLLDELRKLFVRLYPDSHIAYLAW